MVHRSICAELFLCYEMHVSHHAPLIDRALAKILKLPPRLFRQCRCTDVPCSPARSCKWQGSYLALGRYEASNLPSEKRSVIFSSFLWSVFTSDNYSYLFKLLFITVRYREQFISNFLKHCIIQWIFYVKLVSSVV